MAVKEVQPVSNVAQDMPINSLLRVFTVDSTDGKGKYYVQLMRIRLEHAETQIVTNCTCMAAFNNVPLSIAGVKPFCCKHAEQVAKEVTERTSDDQS